MLDISRVRAPLPAVFVLLLGCLASVAAGYLTQRFADDRMAVHAYADATRFQHLLEQDVGADLNKNQGLASYFAASANAAPGERAFLAYVRTADMLVGHPRLSSVGYLARVTRADLAHFEATESHNNPGFAVRGASRGAGDLFPSLYSYPDGASARRLRGIDFAAFPESLSAMQQARDTALSTAATLHVDLSNRARTPTVALFTPVYRSGAPPASLADRRTALRGFTVSIYDVDDVIERVMGAGFRTLFELDIYDGAERPDKLLYDGNKRPDGQRGDAGVFLARQGDFTFANRTWKLFFYAKPVYAERYRTTHGVTIMLFGLAVSVALSCLTGAWLRRLRTRQREEFLRFDTIFEGHPSGMYMLDREYRFVNVNAQALRDLKMSKADLVGKYLDEFVVPENRARAYASVQDVLSGASASYESACIGGTGERIEVSVNMMPISVGGKVVGVLGTAQNITARKADEWRLQESKRMLRLVIANIPQRVFWKDAQLTYLGCNEAFCRDAGLERPENIVGKSDFDLPWRENAEAYRKDDLEVLSAKQPKINYEERQWLGDGSELWLRTSKIPLTDIDGRIMAVLGLYEDITERKRLERQLKELAHYDSLTGLANRAFFYHHLELLLSRVKRRQQVAALLYLDLDNFKTINDTWGHDAGDALLQAFARRIKDAVRDTDLVARLGGDEFAVLLEDLPDRAAGESVAQKLVTAMQLPLRLGSREVVAGTSVGVAFLEPGMPGKEVVRRADQAMYRAKRGGRNRYEVDDFVA